MTASADQLAALTLLLTVGLVAAEVLKRPALKWILKPLAASGFVATAWAGGAATSPYGRWILVGLLFSWLGDIALLARRTPWIFQAGLGSFLLGHLAYCAAFVTRGLSPAVVAGGMILVAIAAVPTLRWLEPNLSAGMKGPVRAYVAAISLMVVLAASTSTFGGNLWILAGALAFYVSDLAVARERFVTPSSWNGIWGTPAYFGGQVILALTVR